MDNKEKSLLDLIEERNKLITDLGFLEENRYSVEIKATRDFSKERIIIFGSPLPDISRETNDIFNEFLESKEIIKITKEWLKVKIEKLDNQIHSLIK